VFEGGSAPSSDPNFTDALRCEARDSADCHFDASDAYFEIFADGRPGPIAIVNADNRPIVGYRRVAVHACTKVFEDAGEGVPQPTKQPREIADPAPQQGSGGSYSEVFISDNPILARIV
jgi:hypothetical protein